MDVYNLGVPLQSEIANPFKPKPRSKKNSLLPKTIQEPDDDFTSWNSRDFVDYFALQYQKIIGGVYKKTYSSDCSHINSIKDFMDSNELDMNEWTKKFIDWCFINKEYISSLSGSFLLSGLNKQLNTYYQQVISVNKQSKPIVDIFDELADMVINGKTKEALTIYGIPIVSTYIQNFKNISDKSLIIGYNKLFKTLSDGDADTQKLLTKIIQRSISRSPYPDEFVMLNWRNEFSGYIEKYKNELWWRNDDYSGSYQYNFNRFINNG